MKSQINELKNSKMSMMSKKQSAIRSALSIALVVLVLFTPACKKDSISGPGGNGAASIDNRLLGTWENQEILGSGSFTQINVEQLTFNANGTGFEETFSIGSLGESGRSHADYTWFVHSGNKLNFKFPGQNGFDATFILTDGQDAIAITFPNGTRMIYSRPN